MRSANVLSSSKFVGRYVHDKAFRASVGIYSGMVVNLAYALFRLVVGVIDSSAWLVSSAVYFLLLGIFRAALANSYRIRNKKGGYSYEKIWYKRTAFLLFLLNIPIGTMILLFIKNEAKSVYPWYTIYASAAYTFYMLILSIINLARFRKFGSPILSASRVISFIAALISLLGLQNALINEFSDRSVFFHEAMNAFTGTGIYAIIIVVEIFMVCRSANMYEVTNDEQIGEQVF